MLRSILPKGPVWLRPTRAASDGAGIAVSALDKPEEGIGKSLHFPVTGRVKAKKRPGNFFKVALALDPILNQAQARRSSQVSGDFRRFIS